MSFKRCAESDVFFGDKKQRKRLSLELKLDVLQRLESGERQTDICKTLGLAGSTVRTILKNAEKIKEYVKVSTPLDTVRFPKKRPSIVVVIEKLLYAWIEENSRRGVSLSFTLIQEKAKSLYSELRKDFPETSDDESFTVSQGWFTRFMRSVEMRNIALNGDIAHVDEQAALNFKNELLGIIIEGGYLPQQVFNVDETGLFWKRLPSKTYLSREESSSPNVDTSKDRLTLLLGCNAAGDFKLKPMVVYHTETPKSLKGYSKNCLPVIWRSNRKAWVNKQVFESWFTAYFCPAVKEYCTQNNLDNKALLIVDAATGHPTTLEDFGQNVKVIFLPLHTNSLLQPMDQGIITLFKACYTRRLLMQAAWAVDGEDISALTDFWKCYNIRQAIENIVSAWDELCSKTMHEAWRNVWPDCIEELLGFDESLDAIQNKIVELGKKTGLEDMELSDVLELLQSHKEELTYEELVELQRSLEEEVESAEDEDSEPARALTITNLTEFFRHLDSALAVIYENDPNMQRSTSVARGINNLANCYRDLYSEKRAKKQPSLASSLYFPQNTFSGSSAVSSPSTEECQEIRPEQNNMDMIMKVELE